MIRAFRPTDKVFNSNGDAVIQATKARVKNSDNGDFYLELTCGTEYNDFLTAGGLLVAPTPAGDQAFRIRTIVKRSNKLEIKAYHVYYDADNYLIADSYAYQMTCQQALDHFNAALDETSPFTVYSDILDLNNYRCVRKSFSECIKTVLERWNGHLKRDNWNISVMSEIGIDNGITIQYRKNLKELKASYDWSKVCTKLLPVGKDGILLTDLYVYSDIQYSIPYTKTVNFSQDIDQSEYATEEQYRAALREDLKKQAEEYLKTYSIPTVNYELKGNPEKVTDIGDIIEVKDDRIGVDIMTSVIAYEFDAVTGQYVSLEFGNFTNGLNNLLGLVTEETGKAIANSEINAAYDVSQALSNTENQLNQSINATNSQLQDEINNSNMQLQEQIGNINSELYQNIVDSYNALDQRINETATGMSEEISTTYNQLASNFNQQIGNTNNAVSELRSAYENTSETLDGDVNFKAGDRMAINTYIANGIITHGYDMIFSVPTDRNMKNLTPNCESLTINVRNVAGGSIAIFTPSADPNFTISMAKASDRLVTFTVTKNSSWGLGNNVIVSVEIVSVVSFTTP